MRKTHYIVSLAETHDLYADLLSLVAKSQKRYETVAVICDEAMDFIGNNPDAIAVADINKSFQLSFSEHTPGRIMRVDNEIH